MNSFLVPNDESVDVECVSVSSNDFCFAQGFSLHQHFKYRTSHICSKYVNIHLCETGPGLSS